MKFFRDLLDGLLRSVAARLPSDVITGKDGTDYLRRYTLFGWHHSSPRRYPFNVRLHEFVRPDEDRLLHDHPWSWAASLILLGGYEEERRVPGTLHTTCRRRYLPGSLVFFGADTFHRIGKLYGKSTWTLFITGPKTASWYFLRADGLQRIPWRKHLGIEEAEYHDV